MFTFSKPKFFFISVGLLIIGLLVGRFSAPTAHHDHSGHGPTGGGAANSEAPTTWTCSMHPQIKLPKEGKCPICFMDLIPLTSSGGEEGPRELKMSEAALALAEIETTEVKREEASVKKYLVGKISIDTTKVQDMALLTEGEIRKLFVSYEGITVKKGDHLAEIYSPEVYAAGQDYLVALSSPTVDRELIASTLKKLKLLAVPEDYIQNIEKSRKVPEVYTLKSPTTGFVKMIKGYQGMWLKKGVMLLRIVDMSSLWANLDAYESDLAWVRYGQKVAIRAEAIPGKNFDGMITYIPPELDDRTRTVKIRVNVPNPNFELKPGMFVSAILESKVSSKGSVITEELKGKWISPMHPEIIKEGPGSCDVCGMALVKAEDLGHGKAQPSRSPLLIPVSSVLITGKRAVVYIRKPGDSPAFEGREIVLGPRAGHQYVVLEGLKEGELIVSKGNFKIDSALQIQAKPSMMSMEGGDSLLQSPNQEEIILINNQALKESTVDFIDIYLEIQAKLTKDDFSGVTDLASDLKGELDYFDYTELNPKELERWNLVLDSLNKSMEHLHHYRDIESFRKGYKKVSNEIITMIKRIGHAKKELHHMYCSMADGHWLQDNKTLLNPYYGQSMLRCGDVEESLPQAPVAE